MRLRQGQQEEMMRRIKQSKKKKTIRRMNPAA